MSDLIQMQKDIEAMAKRANQRIASATPGQQRALQSYLNKYYGFDKFSRSKAKTVGEAAIRLKQLENFLSSKQTTKRGWKAIKAKAVQAANETLQTKGYNLTDDELATILEETDAKGAKQFYRILDLVQAEKYETEGKGGFNLEKAIVDAVKSKVTAGEAIKRKLSGKQKAEKAEELREKRSQKNKADRQKGMRRRNARK